MNNSELEVSQTYRIRFVAELPKVYSGATFEFSRVA